MTAVWLAYLIACVAFAGAFTVLAVDRYQATVEDINRDGTYHAMWHERIYDPDPAAGDWDDPQ